MAILSVVLWLGLLAAVVIVLAITAWCWWKKRPVKRLLLMAAILIGTWFSLAPSFDWLGRRDLMRELFGKTFSPHLIYKTESQAFLESGGTALYLYEIPEAKIQSLMDVVNHSRMTLPQWGDGSNEYRMVHWRNAPFLDDTNEVQPLAFSGGGDPAFGVSFHQLSSLMQEPSTLFACRYRTSGLSSVPDNAYIVDLYILIPDKRRLIVIFRQI